MTLDAREADATPHPAWGASARVTLRQADCTSGGPRSAPCAWSATTADIGAFRTWPGSACPAWNVAHALAARWEAPQQSRTGRHGPSSTCLPAQVDASNHKAQVVARCLDPRPRQGLSSAHAVAAPRRGGTASSLASGAVVGPPHHARPTGPGWRPQGHRVRVPLPCRMGGRRGGRSRKAGADVRRAQLSGDRKRRTAAHAGGSGDPVWSERESGAVPGTDRCRSGAVGGTG